MDVECQIYLLAHTDAMPGFRPYLANKYRGVKWGRASDYAYLIGVTIYPEEYHSVAGLDPQRHFYISHSYDPTRTPRNVFYLAGMARKNLLKHAVLPFCARRRHPVWPPVFLVQGDFRKRDMDALLPLLISKQPHPYRLLLLGHHLTCPALLGWPNVLLRENLDYVDFHREASRASGILTLVSRKKHPQYYTSKLTSSITYARAYGLRCVIDEALQGIYQLDSAHPYKPGSSDGLMRSFSGALEALHRQYTTEESGRRAHHS